MARPRFQPSQAQRNEVKNMAGIGMSQDCIAGVLEIAPKTLRRYFDKELRKGKSEGDARLHQALYKSATEGNVVALIFLAKVRLGMRESAPTPVLPCTPAPFLVRIEGRP